MQPGNVLQAQIRSISVVQPPRGFPHGLQSFCADRWSEAHKQAVPLAILHDPWSEGIPEEVELRVRICSLTASVLAVYDLRLVWMHLKAALRKPGIQRRHDGLRLLFRLAVHQSIIRIATPGNARVRPGHPGIERVVQKEIGQNGTDHATLRGSLGALHQGSLRHLERRRQPSSDV